MITSNIEPILIVTGALTAIAVIQCIAPSWTVRHVFGEALSGEASTVVARHWGLLLLCVGMLLIYSAFSPPIRKPVVILAAVEKAGFVACVCGTSLRHHRVASVLAASDAAMALLYVLYLFGY